MCLYPKLIRNPKYRVNKKNGGNVPAVSDERVTLVPIKCGKCIECCKQTAREWQVRLLEDIRTNTNGKFITLTLSDKSYKELYEYGGNYLEGYDLDNQIITNATRLFLERWRKTHKKSLRHWFVSELGHEGTENIHLHGIVWTNETYDKIESHWKYGYIWRGQWVNEQTVNYCIKYVHKIDADHPNYKSIILTSPGIGANYTKNGNYKNNKYKGNDTNETYKTRTGHKISLPIYWRNKIYTEHEREELWIRKLDKEERWVLGNKIDISKNEHDYNNGLTYARELNKRLGYGSDERNYEQEQYERNKRIIMQQTRINKANNNNKK